MLTSTIIPKDTLILFSSGEYSDYNVYGLAITLMDINPEVLRNEYINMHPEETAHYRFDEQKFIAFLKKEQVLKDVVFSEWYLGGYGKIDTMRIDTNGPMLFT